jgi:hypothetical protein
MNCKEYEEFGLGAERDSALSALDREAAKEHAASCSNCAALQDSWQSVRRDLSELASLTSQQQAPARVEMRLRQEFRTRHRTLKIRRRVVVAGWALAAVAVLVGVMSWRNWNAARELEGARRQATVPSAANATMQETLVADSDLSGFTMLPGSDPADAEGAAIVRVRLQRSSRGVLGLPVNEERAAEWIQVDLLVGDDGLPEAVRLLQE